MVAACHTSASRLLELTCSWMASWPLPHRFTPHFLFFCNPSTRSQAPVSCSLVTWASTWRGPGGTPAASCSLLSSHEDTRGQPTPGHPWTLFLLVQTPGGTWTWLFPCPLPPHLQRFPSPKGLSLAVAWGLCVATSGPAPATFPWPGTWPPLAEAALLQL